MKFLVFLFLSLFLLSCDCITGQRVDTDHITEKDLQDLALVHAYEIIKNNPESIKGFYELQLVFEYLYNGVTVEPSEAHFIMYSVVDNLTVKEDVKLKLKKFVDGFISYYGILRDRKDVIECYYYGIMNARKFHKFETTRVK